MMPNNVINEVIIRDIDPMKQGLILASVRNTDGFIDFDLLVPAPKNIWHHNTADKHLKAFRKSHLDWARENWGTKWNAYGFGDDEAYKPIIVSDNQLVLTFQTAWSPPYGWLVALFNTFKISFEHNWLSEGMDYAYHAIFNWPAMKQGIGEPWNETVANEQTCRHMHKLLWGVEKFDDDAA